MSDRTTIYRPRRAERRYVGILVTAAFLGLFAVAGVSVLVDPYWLFDAPRITGFNFWKTQLGNSTRTVKPQHVSWDRPHNIVVGASSAEAGLDPTNQVWGGSGYNMAYGGGKLDEAVRSLAFAVRNGARRVVLVVDFQRFHADEKRGPLQLPEVGEDVPGWFGNSRLFLKTMQVTLGVDALRDAAFTILEQSKVQKSDRPEAHQVIGRNGLRQAEYSQALLDKAGGHIPAFRRSVVNRMTRGWFPDPCRRWRFADDKGHMKGFRLFEDALRIARKAGIELYIVIAPTHAVMHLSMETVGLYDAYEEWKRQLTDIVAREHEVTGGAAFPLYDFGVISDITAEPLPEHDGRLEGFTDPLHFRPKIGALIFERLFGSNPDAVRPEFGRRLTPQTIARHQAENRARLNDLPQRQNLFTKIIEPSLAKHATWIGSNAVKTHCQL